MRFTVTIGCAVLAWAATCLRAEILPKATDVVRQDGKGFPETWGSKDNNPVPAWYKMEPDICGAPEYRDSMERSLDSLPSVFLTLPVEDLFGVARGIYAHPESAGEAWERRGSFTFLEKKEVKIRVDCGVRVQGGWNRRPEESPKHSFRLTFKKRYGMGKLHYPVLGSEGPDDFDSLILRAGCNNTWLHARGVERRRGEYIRDQWMRDTLRDMGQPSAAGTFVHLYLNGLYWGVYNLSERPDAGFAAAHFGGAAIDYDSFNADKLLMGRRDGFEELMKRVNAGVKTRADLARVSELLDLKNFADYMLANIYGANADWDRASNWYAARRRDPPGPFRFLVWDGERTLEGVRDDTFDFDDDLSPPRIFHRLIENEDFRRLFSERAKLHLRDDGALAPGRCAARYKKWSDRLDLAMIAESARWGGYRSRVHRYKEGPYEVYTRDAHWRPEVRRLLEDYFPKRTAVVVDLLRQRGIEIP